MEHCIIVALVTSGGLLVPRFVPVKGGCICTSWDHGVGHKAAAYWVIMTVRAVSLLKRSLTNVNALT